MTTKSWIVPAVVLMLMIPAAMAAGPAPAGRHSLGVSVGQFMPTGDDSFSGDPFDYETWTFDNEIDDATGVGVTYEYRINDLVGVQAGIGYYKPDVTARISVDEVPARDTFVIYDWKDSVRLMPVTLGANFHLFRGGKVDVFVAPELAYVTYSDLKAPAGGASGKSEATEDFVTMEFEDEFTFGLRAGIGVALGPRWSFIAGVEYLAASAKVERAQYHDVYIDEKAPAQTEAEEIPIYKGRKFDPKPLVISIGAAYRF